MGLPIISADQRLAERHGVKLVLLGFWGLGKTTQLKTLPEASTLFNPFGQLDGLLKPPQA